MYRCDLAHACIRPNNNNTLLLPRLLRLTTRSYQKHSLARHFVVVACVALRHNFALVCGIALEFSPVCAVTFARQPTVRRPLPGFFSFCGGFRNTAAAMHYVHCCRHIWPKSNKIYDRICFFAQASIPQSFKVSISCFCFCTS